jgi:hypothetical protein
MNVLKFPYAVSRRAHARKLRWSKNGTPEERAADLAAQIETLPADDKALVTQAIDGFLQEQQHSPLPGLRVVGGLDTEPAPTVEHGAEEISDTCRNGRLRHRRRAAWRAADAARIYWRARWKLENAIAVAQSSGIAEGSNHPIRHWTASDGGQEMLANYREAIGKQLLTPAFDRCAVTWKKAALKAGDHEYTGVTTARAERAIADDLAFLAAHPVRQSKRRGAPSQEMRTE